ncbi:hypothetical protein BGZ70_000557, partial [Mortierella alpina]
MANPLAMFCLVDGEAPSRAFPVSISFTATVGDLKDLVSAKKPNGFSDVDANKLTLWRVSYPITAANRHTAVLLSSMDSATELEPVDDIADVFQDMPPKRTVHIIVQRPPPARSPPVSDYISQKRPTGGAVDLPANKKIRITEGWTRYTASDGEAVDLPPSWIGILADTELDPEPRAAFNHLKDDLRAGDAIIVPSIGQTPKGFGQDRRLFVTEQMLELWEDMRGDQESTYRRVLAGLLDTEHEDESALEVVKRFLALNKDILTGAELGMLVNDYNGTRDISRNAVWVIFRHLLMSKDRKTLLLVDEHRKLFEKEPYVPDRFKSLVPLKSYHWWGEDAKGSRVVFTGTAHAKYEMSILDPSYRPTSVVFIGPLSRHVFSKLLDTYPRLAAPTIREEVTAVTNCVPRELAYLSAAVEDLPEPISLDNLDEWTERRTKNFLWTANTYYESRTPFWANDFYKALLQTFLGSTSIVNFEWDFLDLGLIYRSKDI